MNRPTSRVAVICTGNICRSPMGEVLLRTLVANDPSLRDQVLVTSAGTARWHVGDAMDERARRALDRAGLSAAGSPAAYASRDYLRDQHLVLVMTREHRHDVSHRRGDGGPPVVLWRAPSEGVDLDVADPYYGGDAEFDECLALLRRGAPRLLELLRHGVRGEPRLGFWRDG